MWKLFENVDRVAKRNKHASQDVPEDVSQALLCGLDEEFSLWCREGRATRSPDTLVTLALQHALDVDAAESDRWDYPRKCAIVLECVLSATNDDAMRATARKIIDFVRAHGAVYDECNIEQSYSPLFAELFEAALERASTLFV